jgi:hypothetical protein
MLVLLMNFIYRVLHQALGSSFSDKLGVVKTAQLLTLEGSN